MHRGVVMGWGRAPVPAAPEQGERGAARRGAGGRRGVGEPVVLNIYDLHRVRTKDGRKYNAGMPQVSRRRPRGRAPPGRHLASTGHAR